MRAASKFVHNVFFFSLLVGSSGCDRAFVYAPTKLIISVLLEFLKIAVDCFASRAIALCIRQIKYFTFCLHSRVLLPMSRRLLITSHVTHNQFE